MSARHHIPTIALVLLGRIVLAQPNPHITTNSLPGGLVGIAYGQTLAAGGGRRPYQWSLASGSLPAGVSLAPSGTISGTPTAAGTSNFTVEVTDARGKTDTQPLSLAVAAALAVITTSLPRGMVGSSYDQQLSASGGSPPYQWSISAAGALPQGLAMNRGGEIGGTPTATGTFNFTVQAKDSSGATANQPLSLAIDASLTVTTSSLPNGTIAANYSQMLAASGGTGGYSWSVTAGSLPQGLNLSAGGVISGTPSAVGNSTFTVQVSDSSVNTATKQLSITINRAALTIATSSLPNGAVGANYSQTLSATGGTGGYTWSVTAGSLPSGLNLSTAGSLSGTPSTAGTSTFTAQVQDSSGATATKALSITVSPATLTVATPSLPNGTVGASYSQTLSATGGTGGYTWSVTVGSLPSGLNLSSAGALSGTPSTAGTSTFTAQVQDSSGATATKPLSITVSPATLTVATSSLPNGTVGATYSQTLSATGGTGGYTWSVTVGSLPSGLNLSTAGVLSGTPSTSGTSTFTAQVQDRSGATATKALSITVSPATLTIATSSLPNGTVGATYSQTLSATGGTGGYSWSISAASLPSGLNLSTAGVLSGTSSTSGTSTFTAQVQDSSGATATKALSITVSPATLTVATSSLPNGTVGATYSQTLSATGGTGGYTWSVTAGSLPSGLNLSTAGVLSGTPSTPGTSTFTAQVQDSSGATATKPLSITVSPATLTVATSSLANGTVGASYSQTLSATGGTGGYTWSVTAGSLPSGLNLSTAGALSGTPSTPGTSTFTAQVQDSSGATATKPLSITVSPATLTVATSSLANGTVGASYSQTLSATGGTGGYTWSVTAGSLPSGLNLSTAGALSGTPSTPGTSTFTAQVQDSSGATATKALSITVSPATLTVATSSLPNGTVGASYSQTLSATGGAGGYTWSVTAGSLPSGLNLSTAGALSGTPSTPGTSTFTAQVQDSSGATATKPLSITVSPATLTVATSSLPNGTVGASYSQTLSATGGAGGYTWSVTAGSLPSGLNLSTAGALSGTPSTPGTSTFTAQVRDSSGATAPKQFTITVNASTLIILSPAALPAGLVAAPYSATLSATGGVSPYTWTSPSGSFPPGLSLSPTGVISGTPSTAGGFIFTVQVADSAGAKAIGQSGIGVRGTLSISTSATLASGSAGVAFSQPLTATGGTPPYTWAVASGALPIGLSLSAITGIISGTPTQVGSFQITIQVTDASSATASGKFSFTIVNGLVITNPPVLPTATVGAAYNVALTAAGGNAPYQWSITAGALPGGVAFSASGQLSGTPAAAGNFTFTAQTVDGLSHRVTKDFTLAVAAALTITSAPTLPAAASGASYRQAISVAGGTPPYLWSVAAGSLPGGITLDSATGLLSGTPTTPGTFNFAAVVTDANSVTAQQALTILVGQGLTVTAPASLPDATAGSSYSFKLSASGGQQPYSWVVMQGALPSGLSLDPASGVIAGMPTAAGAYSFTVQASDSSGLTTSHAENLAVNLPALAGMQIAGLAGAIGSLQQPPIDVALPAPYPVSITGVLNLSFTPANNTPADPAVQFSTGGSSATFTVPAGATHATFATPQFAIQTGSLAGTLSVSVTSLQADGAPLPLPAGITVTTQIPAAAPSIRSINLTPSSGGIRVQLVAMSNTRELTQATVIFQPATGSALETGSLVVPLGDASKAWFQGTSSAPYGGQFTLTIPFSVAGASSVVGGVSIVLSNSIGDSSPAGASQ